MPSGAKPGERRGGRAKGTPNKITADIKALAQQYGALAIKRLAHLVEHAESEQAQVAAIRELLDRGYGKSKQELEHSGPGGGALQVEALRIELVHPPSRARPD